METNHYKKVAVALIEQVKPISIEKLALITNLPLKELEQVLTVFGKAGFLKNKNFFKNIQLTDKARGNNS